MFRYPFILGPTSVFSGNSGREDVPVAFIDWCLKRMFGLRIRGELNCCFTSSYRFSFFNLNKV